MIWYPKEGLTEDGQEAEKNDGERSHAQPENLFLLHELAVVAGVARLADAGVTLDVLPVNTGATVVTRVVQAFIAIHAVFTVRGHTLAPRTPSVIQVSEV